MTGLNMQSPRDAKPARRRLRTGVLVLGVSAFAGLALALFGGSYEARGAWCPTGYESEVVTVRAGDTLSAIAARHGISVKEALRTNPGVEANNIRQGQSLSLCVPTSSASSGASSSSAKPSSKSTSSAKSNSKAKSDTNSDSSKSTSSSGAPGNFGRNTGKSCGSGGSIYSHEVLKGQTLAKIAQEYGVTKDSILRRNKELAANPASLKVGQTVAVCVERNTAKKSPLCGNETPLYVHEVIPGEHISDIAARYGIRRKDLLKLNKQLASNPNLIRPGQELRVCPDIAPHVRERITHEVSSGETLSGIAAKYDLSVRELTSYQQGKLDTSEYLKVGTRLVVWRDGDIAPGFGGVDYDDDNGVLPHGVQMPVSRNYVVKTPAYAWGTAKTIDLLQNAINRYRKKVPTGPKVHLGDISRKGGGPLAPHKSHQHGRDIDIGYVLLGEAGDETRFLTANAKNLDVPRTWALIKALVDTNEVRYIFMDWGLQKLLYDYAREKGVSEDELSEIFQYPRSRKRSAGIIRHWKGHENHFHVRFHK